MPTKYARISITRDPALEANLLGLSSYAKQHKVERESDLIRAMLEAGYDALRREELREAVCQNIGAQDDSIGPAAARALAKDGLD